MEARYWAWATAVERTALTTNNATRSEMVRLMDSSSVLRKYGWRPIDFISTTTLKKRFSRIRLLIAQPIFDSQEYCKTGGLRLGSHGRLRTSDLLVQPAFRDYCCGLPRKGCPVPTVIAPVGYCECCVHVFV